MTTAISLHLGLNRVDSTHYGSEFPLRGCHRDALDMARIAAANGYEGATLLDAEARCDVLLGRLREAARRLQAGDHLLLTYSGHGARIADRDGDEADGLDETWVLYERMLIDDELYTAFAQFATGVRLMVLSDSCHSGSIARAHEFRALARAAGWLPSPYEEQDLQFRTPAELDFGKRVWSRHGSRYAELLRSVPKNSRELIRAALIQISACQDDQLAADGVQNGLFTSKLLEVWANGTFEGNHRAFYQAISRKMPATQSPNYMLLGNDVSAFEKQSPFTVSINSSSGEIEMLYSHASHSDQGNWEAVRAELQQRFPNGQTIPMPNLAVSQPVASLALQHPSAESPLLYGAALPAARAASGPAIVRTFFWGFHIEVSSQGLRDFLSVADPITAIVASIGPVTGPAAPFVTLAAAFAAGALQLLRGLDRGNGVYISMSWFAPGVFIPTTVTGRGVSPPSASRARGIQNGEPQVTGTDLKLPAPGDAQTIMTSNGKGVHPGSKEVDIHPQDSRAFPSWAGLGVTNVRITNLGDQVASVSFIAGAGFETNPVQPGLPQTFARQWGGAWVHVRNESQTSLIHVEVW